MTSPVSKLPRTGKAREALREKGQFWTPDWAADIMISYVLALKPSKLLDPALGEGVFFRAAKRYAGKHAFSLKLWGCDIDPAMLDSAKRAGLSATDLLNVEIRDFVFDPPKTQFPAIVVNPPYIRHHRISLENKKLLQEFSLAATGCLIDGRAGLHVYFLIRALETLEPGGRLAYIVSADICEGIFASSLWQWICSRYRLDAVVSFEHKATPFPNVDTNALIFCISNLPPVAELDWIKCHSRDPEELIAYFEGKVLPRKCKTIQRFRRPLSEALETGLSRPPDDGPKSKYTLGDFASTMRGAVTGANDFFLMTKARVKEMGIPDRFLVKIIGRMRDIQGDAINPKDLIRLENAGRPTRMLYLNGHEIEQLPPNIQDYLESGVSQGLPEKALIKARKKWYWMESREIPPILFAYLGRRNARFIRNNAEVVPLTCLLCVYPKWTSTEFCDRLWEVLAHPDTIDNLKKVGKSYGSGAIKVEPRALERLPLPDRLVESAGLAKFIGT